MPVSAGSPAAAIEREAATWRHRLVMGTAFALPVAILSMGGMLPGLESVMRGPLVIGALPLGWIVQAVLAAVVQVTVCSLHPVTHADSCRRQQHG